MKPSTLRRHYLSEAAMMLILARIALWILPASQIFGWANRPQRRCRRFASAEASWTAWSIETLSSKSWIGASCLSCAIAAHAMLRRRGIASRLCLGVARDDRTMVAHAWVESGQRVIVGAAEAARVSRIAEFGGEVRR